MANHYSLCLVGAMDRLWFHQIILFPEPISLLGLKALETAQPISKSLACPPLSLSLPPLPDEQISSVISLLPDEEISSDSSPISPLDDCKNEDEEEISQKERGLRLNPIRGRRSSHSSPTSTQKLPRSLGDSAAMRRLYKSMSCKTLGELELEEVKGFMDLGFIFKKEHLSPRMMSVVPGLQRLGVYKDKQSTKLIDFAKVVKDDETEEGKEKRVIRRPYLSEAWFIKRPDSPVLNLWIPRASAAADMKKHVIRFWARTVASVIQQESQYNPTETKEVSKDTLYSTKLSARERASNPQSRLHLIGSCNC